MRLDEREGLNRLWLQNHLRDVSQIPEFNVFQLEDIQEYFDDQTFNCRLAQVKHEEDFFGHESTVIYIQQSTNPCPAVSTWPNRTPSS